MVIAATLVKFEPLKDGTVSIMLSAHKDQLRGIVDMWGSPVTVCDEKQEAQTADDPTLTGVAALISEALDDLHSVLDKAKKEENNERE